jgi:hypothetical protein
VTTFLWSAEGASNTEIADRLPWTKATVGKWRRRFLGQRVLCSVFMMNCAPAARAPLKICTLSTAGQPVQFHSGGHHFTGFKSGPVM